MKCAVGGLVVAAVFAGAAFAQPKDQLLSFATMAPLVPAYETCWVLNLQNESRLDCMAVVDGKLRAANRNRPLTKNERAYSQKFIESIMLRQWYDRAVARNVDWPERFVDPENLSNACSEDATAQQTIDCIHKESKKYLVPAWYFLNGGKRG